MQYERYKLAKNKFKEIDNKRENTLIIHYSCESFDGYGEKTPRVTSIAILNFATHQTDSFSIQLTAEELGINLDGLHEDYDTIEKKMLDGYFEFIKEHKNYLWIHWNMRDVGYGFQAIEHRYRVLLGTSNQVPEQNRIDLANLFIDFYGKNYIEHPRLKNIIEKNGISIKDFIEGKREPEVFKNKEFTKLHLSTLRKVQAMADLLDLVIARKLKTNSKWYERSGLTVQGVYEYVREKWWFALLSFFVGTIFGIFIEQILQ